jgi:uncharacterized membrane protein YeaQ/YmgE (transglycosylase-associated protein family)
VTLEAFVLALIAGLVAGSLAGFIMKGGDYGLVGDVLLGIGGSIVGSWVFRTLGIASGGGWFAMVTIAFVGAVIIIAAHRVAHRMLWPVRT